MNSFAALGVSAPLSEQLKSLGIVKPTEVQQQAIPILLDGKDVIAQAQTGTGKTLAFALPILEKIQTDHKEPQALIITPTRELAIQITNEMKKLSPIVGASVLAVYGGQDVEGQIRKLKGAAHIIVATPGRLLDHLRRETIHFSSLKIFVLDEADQMLDMGFLTEVKDILHHIPFKRQTMLCSATMPDEVRRLASSITLSAQDIRIQSQHVTLDDIKQYVVETADRAKQQHLFSLIERFQPYLAVLFCRTKIRAKKLTEALLDNGFNADELHGDLSQAKRELVMKRFREAKIQLLVATDVAARGLDVEGVTHVFNYDVPLDAESYIHRIGRTGRAGQTGMAITFVAPKDEVYLRKIENGIRHTIKRKQMIEWVGESDRRSSVNLQRTNDSFKAGKRSDRKKSSKPKGTANKPNQRKKQAAAREKTNNSKAKMGFMKKRGR